MIPRARESRIDELFTNGHPYTALEAGPTFNFRWEPADVREVIHLWDAGVSMLTIAAKFDRDPDELAVLVIDLARRGVIGERQKRRKGMVA